MNRRNVLTAMLASFITWLFTGRKYGKASPRTIAAAHNGIISVQRTPWLLGCKVYVNGRLIPRVKMVNATKGFVVAYGDKPDCDWAVPRRIYGWIDIDDSDCMNQSVVLNHSKHSVTVD